jgi:hypothetical protein
MGSIYADSLAIMVAFRIYIRNEYNYIELTQTQNKY